MCVGGGKEGGERERDRESVHLWCGILVSKKFVMILHVPILSQFQSPGQLDQPLLEFPFCILQLQADIRKVGVAAVPVTLNCESPLPSYKGLLAPAFVTCSNSAREGWVKLITCSDVPGHWVDV